MTKPAPAKASAAKAEPKPEPSKPAFDKKFLDEQRIMLNVERAKYLHSAQMLKAEADALVFEREPGDVQFDEKHWHSGAMHALRRAVSRVPACCVLYSVCLLTPAEVLH